MTPHHCPQAQPFDLDLPTNRRPFGPLLVCSLLTTAEGGREPEGREPPLEPQNAALEDGYHRVGQSIASVGHTPRHKAVRTVDAHFSVNRAALVCLDQRVMRSGEIRSPLTACTGISSPHGVSGYFLAARPVAWEWCTFHAVHWRMGFGLPPPTMPPPVRWGRHSLWCVA